MDVSLFILERVWKPVTRHPILASNYVFWILMAPLIFNPKIHNFFTPEITVLGMTFPYLVIPICFAQLTLVPLIILFFLRAIAARIERNRKD